MRARRAVTVAAVAIALGLTTSRPDWAASLQAVPGAGGQAGPSTPIPLRAAVVGYPRLSPGVGRPVDVRLTNPNARAVTVTSVAVSVDKVIGPRSTARRPCGTGDFSGRAGSTGHLRIAPGSTVTLSQAHIPQDVWPQLSMIDSPVNQDGCKGAELLLTVTVAGTAP